MPHFSLRLKAYNQPLLQRAQNQVQSVLHLLRPIEKKELEAAQAKELKEVEAQRSQIAAAGQDTAALDTYKEELKNEIARRESSAGRPSGFENAPLVRANPGGVIHFPKQRSLYTVLSGPHVHKKSREQFELITRQIRLEFELGQGEAELFYQLLKNMYFTGCQLQVRIKSNSYLFLTH